MKDHTRRAVALIAGSAINHKSSTSVFDYQYARYFSFSLSFNGSNVNAYDYTLNCYVAGSLNSLYHYGDNNYIHLTMKSNGFDGFDYESNNHFQATVSGNNVTIYDYETNQYHNYSI